MDFESHFKSYLKKRWAKAPYPAQKLLRRALFYSLLGKASRFRPRLCFASAQFFGQSPEKILPWAISVEMAHCASLIHDDLPSMDKAKTRRGKKCAHLAFGEDTALLAGDCLFVESFAPLKDPLFKKKSPEILGLFLSHIGFQGLMSGQALDLKEQRLSKQKFFKMIQLKTGALISLSLLGPFVLWGKKEKEKKALQSYGESLGRAYQLADDLKDGESFFSKAEMTRELKSCAEKSLRAIQPFGQRAKGLKSLSLLIQRKIP